MPASGVMGFDERILTRKAGILQLIFLPAFGVRVVKIVVEDFRFVRR